MAIPFTIIGPFTNIFILYILIKHKVFPKTTYYLLGISVALYIICNFPTAPVYSIKTGKVISYSDGLAPCSSVIFIAITSYRVSTMSLRLLTIDRYFVIITPLSPFYHLYKCRFIGR